MGGREWKAMTRQPEFEWGQVTNEFVNTSDWYHHAENYIYLYYLGWADPGLADMESRARRFAFMFTGEDPKAPNYDPAFRIISSPSSGARMCHLVTSDGCYLQFLRSHFDMFMEKGREEDGKFLVPRHHMEDGWRDYAPLNVMEPIHLWANSMEERDWVRLERMRRGDEPAWDAVESRESLRASDDRAWVHYITGDHPQYPEQILRANYRQVCQRLEMTIEDGADLSQVDEHHWQDRNSVVTEALVQLTTGGPAAVYWGELAQGRVRDFTG